MARRILWCLALVAAAGCLPEYHPLGGRRCSADLECGEQLVCHRNRCADAGSFSAEQYDLTRLLAEGWSEGGLDFSADGIQRAPTELAITAFTSDGGLPSARQAHAATCAGAHCFIVGGSTATAALAEVLSLETGASLTALPAPRSAHAATATAGRVFVLGGRGADDGLLAEVVSAKVQPDGTLGPWESEPPLTSPRANLVAAVLGGFVYAIGGDTAVGLSGDVLSAPIQPDGRLGAFAPAGMLTPRAQAGAASFDGAIYVVGGSCGGGACATWKLTPAPDAGTGLAMSTLPSPGERLNPAVAIAGGALHVVGGRRSDNSLLTDVLSLTLSEHPRATWRAETRLATGLVGAAAVATRRSVVVSGGRQSDGGLSAALLTARSTNAEVSTFDDAPTVPVVLQFVRSASWGQSLYIAGSTSNAGQIDTVYRTGLALDGGLERWTSAGTLPNRTGDLGLAAWGGRLYAVGGCVDDGTACFGTDRLSVADVFADGGLSTFRDIGPLPGDRQGAGVAVVDGWLIVAGGKRGYTEQFATVWSGRLDPITGTVGEFKTTTPLPVALWSHSVVSMHGQVFVVGGSGGMFERYSTQVYSGKVASDGTIANWVVGPTMPEQRGRTAAAVFDDVLYVGGGCNEQRGGTFCGDKISSVIAASLQPDGGLAPFVPVGTLDWARDSLSLATFAGRLVSIGGYDGNAQGRTESARLYGRQAMGDFATWSALGPRSDFATATDGRQIFVVGGNGTPQVDVATLDPAVFSSTFSSLPPLSAPRDRAAAAVLRGRLYVAGGLQGAEPQAEVWSTDVRVGATQWRVEAALPQKLAGGSLAASASGLFFTGGDGSAAVFAAQLDAEGRITGWSATTALPQARTRHRAVVAGDQMLVLGGEVNGGDVGSVLVSSIAADGTLGVWRGAVGMPGPRKSFGATVADGQLVVAGGEGPSGAQSDVLSATIWPDGSLGSWVSAGTLPSARSGVDLMSAQGSLVLVEPGGAVAVASRFTAPASGSYGLHLDFGRTVSVLEGLTLGGASATGVFTIDAKIDDADWRTLGSVKADDELLIGGPAHHVWLRIHLDDRQSTSGPAPGAVRDLTSLKVAYSL